MRTARLTSALVVLAALLAAGCGGNTAALTVPEALETEGEAMVEGYVFADASGIWLCEAVAESFPPQCGGASLVIEGVDADDFSGLEREAEHRWSDTQRRVRGTVSGDMITVTDPEA